MKLEALPGTELTSYVVTLLQKCNISTVRLFVDADICKIRKCTNLPNTAIDNLKKYLITYYGPKLWLPSHILKMSTNKKRTRLTGITGIDKMFDENAFALGSIWEICGLPGVGKTQFCLSVAVNIVYQFDDRVLYIDTKGDFSGRRIREMLHGHAVDNLEFGRCMHQINIEFGFSPQEVLQILNRLLIQIEQYSDFLKPNLIIIDSIPAVWLQVCGDADLLEGKAMLSKLSQFIHKLAKNHYINFVLVNQIVDVNGEPTENESQNKSRDDANIESMELFEDSQPHGSNDVEIKLALGRYWSSVPEIRISIEIPENITEGSSERIVKILKSCYDSCEPICKIFVTGSGISSE